MIPDPIEHLNVLPLTDDSFSSADMLPSKLFGDEFDRAIIGTTVNEHHRRVIIYDEETLIDLMVKQLREDADEGEEVRWEDGAMWICDGLDQVLKFIPEALSNALTISPWLPCRRSS